jgi:2-polyprenyl-3-methyl-5-hydroxy-6-metoxy-1,4-benzoquinol methylase
MVEGSIDKYLGSQNTEAKPTPERLADLASRTEKDLISNLIDITDLKIPEERIAARSYKEVGIYEDAVNLYGKIKARVDEFDESIDFGKTGLDIGARDGRKTQVIRELGIEKLVAIDPSAEELQKGIDHGLLRPDEIFPDTLEKYVAQGHPQVDSVFVFNVNPDLPRSQKFIDALMRVVKPGGLVVTSFIEEETSKRFVSRAYVDEGVEAIKEKPNLKLKYSELSLIDQGCDYPDKFLSIGRRATPFSWF